jgi:hypothetical protein
MCCLAPQTDFVTFNPLEYSAIDVVEAEEAIIEQVLVKASIEFLAEHEFARPSD